MGIQFHAKQRRREERFEDNKADEEKLFTWFIRFL